MKTKLNSKTLSPEAMKLYGSDLLYLYEQIGHTGAISDLCHCMRESLEKWTILDGRITGEGDTKTAKLKFHEQTFIRNKTKGKKRHLKIVK